MATFVVENKSSSRSTLGTSLSAESETEIYDIQRRLWPQAGRHILAHFDDESIIVYQAYKSSIADYAVEHQRFGGPDYSFERMTWIKTNFLWMMYRSGWATKPGQNRILAIKLTRDGFETILQNAFTASLQKSKGLTNDEISVRLQWDPDHTPTFDKEQRRAIQLGLKGEIVKKFSEEWIIKIEDITDFVREQHRILKMEGVHRIRIPKERVYPVTDPVLSSRITVDCWEHDSAVFVTQKT